MEKTMLQLICKAVKENGYDKQWIQVAVKQVFNKSAFDIDTSVPGMVAFKLASNVDEMIIPARPDLAVEEINFKQKHVKLVIRY